MAVKQPNFAELKSTLAQSPTAKKDDSLYKTIQYLIDKLATFQGLTNDSITNLSKSVTTTPVVTPPSTGGDVNGPAGATDGNLATFDGTTGKKIKDSGVSLGVDGSFTAGAKTVTVSKGIITSIV